jgi:CheY-like chemotaxis protein
MADGSPPGPIQALLVEDEPADARYLLEICKDAPRPIEFHRVATGDEALDYLRRAQSGSGLPRPDLVFLDLNLPRKDGRAVLAEIRADRQLNGIPVVITTASPTDADVLHAFNFRAEGYLRKPVALAELLAILDRLDLVA